MSLHIAIRSHHRAHKMSARHRFGDHISPEKSIRTCDQHLHASPSKSQISFYRRGAEDAEAFSWIKRTSASLRLCGEFICSNSKPIPLIQQRIHQPAGGIHILKRHRRRRVILDRIVRLLQKQI